MSELRKNFLNGNWVIISSERAKRPKDFKPQVEERAGSLNCPFCPGNEKQTPPEEYAIRNDNSQPDTSGWQIRVFPNKFPALNYEVSSVYFSKPFLSELYPGVGKHEVIVETPEHDTDLKNLGEDDFLSIIQTYLLRYRNALYLPAVKYVSLFRNYKREGGASLEHSHSQVLTLPFLPPQIELELRNIREYQQTNNHSLFTDYIEQELKEGCRIIHKGEQFLVLSPFAPRFPFETWVMPLRHFSGFSQINEDEIIELSYILKKTLKALSTLGDPAYNYYFHSLEGDIDFRFHIEILPRMAKPAGFEWDTGVFINYTVPEEAAEYFRVNF